MTSISSSVLSVEELMKLTSKQIKGHGRTRDGDLSRLSDEENAHTEVLK
jgi:hypothetical protein